ncbi:MAG TPA: UDP-N-acetylmuramoyl-L-alanyl-D-glutamate--2,6-diaminopimelate ligase [Bacteroidales bacterium]|nr:UDP-N-acetylmuramoyl-L-alanyl-D-glutamate--2,6-diaminopimelate ligase [Bacteroidales bacterium]
MAKSLKDILYKSSIRELHGSVELTITDLCIDSRQAGPGMLFIARKGVSIDSHQFIPSVIEKGVAAIICEVLPENPDKDITYVLVDNCDKALGTIAANFYDNPSENLILCGVTGTNGKTTITTLLHQLFTSLGYGTGLISTIRVMINEHEKEATHTTPDAIQINRLLQEMVNAGCTYCFMEVSSHAIHQHRISGLVFAGGIFTNITHDHLDYHGDFKAYINAKKAFFDMLPANAFSLVNADDRNASVMLQNTRALKKRYGLKSVADYHAKVLENLFDGLLLEIEGQEVWCRLIGEFNAYNLVAVYAAALLLGQDKSRVLTLMSTLHSAEGRFDHLKSANGITAIIDYAHTPDALQNVLKTINAIRTGNEQLITVVGAGGDRDRAKRPEMARIAGELSSRLILTSDNPRSEDPDDIIIQMKEGVQPLDFKKMLVITNRKEAIHAACALAQAGDIILLAGKGHEKYQEIKGVKYPFDDKKILEEILIKSK